MKREDSIIDLAGVGIGPFNLSVAALLHPLGELRVRFFEREKEFQWHPGLLFPEATIQVSFLKDLVTLADPTSPFSFLSFLFESKRLYRFINANFQRVTRCEFNQYLRWVCSKLPYLEFGHAVEEIGFEGDSLVVSVGGKKVRARNVVLGTGLTPSVPACARDFLGPTVFHACRYLHHGMNVAARRVAVIGGGQTGAEVVNHLLSRGDALPREVHWVSRRLNFQPLDESPFTNELFTPNYSDYFFKLQPDERAHLLKEQRLASDGICLDLLETIYRRLYELEFVEGKRLCTLHADRELVGMRPHADGWQLEVRDRTGESVESLKADAVVLCTGSAYSPPPYLEPLMGRIEWRNGGFALREDYSIVWDGPESLNIYVQNAVRDTRGVADPNLSLMAWRSATVVNSVAGRRVYDIAGANSAFEWGQNGAPDAEGAPLG